MSMQSVTITIGRNIGGGKAPKVGHLELVVRKGDHVARLDDEAWNTFVLDVEQAVTSHALRDHEGESVDPEWVVDNEGEGVWTGVAEQNRVLQWIHPEGWSEAGLVQVLADLADTYAQDSIAVVFGPSRLVGPGA